ALVGPPPSWPPAPACRRARTGRRRHAAHHAARRPSAAIVELRHCRRARPASRTSCETSFRWLLSLLARQPAWSHAGERSRHLQLRRSTLRGTSPSGAQKTLLAGMPKIRNQAMHADWANLTPHDAGSVIGYVEQFLLSHFS